MFHHYINYKSKTIRLLQNYNCSINSGSLFIIMVLSCFLLLFHLDFFSEIACYGGNPIDSEHTQTEARLASESDL